MRERQRVNERESGSKGGSERDGEKGGSQSEEKSSRALILNTRSDN